MKSFSTLALLAALLMFSALGCTEGTDTGTDSTTPPATDTDTGTDTPADGATDTDPATPE